MILSPPMSVLYLSRNARNVTWIFPRLRWDGTRISTEASLSPDVLGLWHLAAGGISTRDLGLDSKGLVACSPGLQSRYCLNQIIFGNGGCCWLLGCLVVGCACCTCRCCCRFAHRFAWNLCMVPPSVARWQIYEGNASEGIGADKSAMNLSNTWSLRHCFPVILRHGLKLPPWLLFHLSDMKLLVDLVTCLQNMSCILLDCLLHPAPVQDWTAWLDKFIHVRQLLHSIFCLLFALNDERLERSLPPCPVAAGAIRSKGNDSVILHRWDAQLKWPRMTMMNFPRLIWKARWQWQHCFGSMLTSLSCPSSDM